MINRKVSGWVRVVFRQVNVKVSECVRVVFRWIIVRFQNGLE